MGAVASFLAQRFQGRMKHLGHKPIGELADFLARALVQFRQAIVESLQLGQLGILQSLAEPGNHWPRRAVPHFCYERVRFLVDDSLGGRQ
jgi:hypothetical protein